MQAPSPLPPPSATAPPAPAGRWLQRLAAFFAVLVVLAVSGGALLWWWSGSEGSLTTTLRWISKSQALAAEDASGSLRAGGHVSRLVWQQDGLTVEAHDVALAWQPWSLVRGTLQLDRLSAARVRVDDQRSPSATPALPPNALELPLRISIDHFSLGQLQWVGPPEVEASSVSGSYLFTGTEHVLVLSSAQFSGGRYQGRASLGAAQPLQLQAVLSGAFKAVEPGRTTPLPLIFNASINGPLTGLAVRAALELSASAGTGATAAANAPRATATARVTPWAAQPLPEASADFQALNIATLWPQAPQTLLTGHASVTPVQPPGNAAATGRAWLFQTRLINNFAGPWDKQRLPLENLEVQGEWYAGKAVIRSLKANIAGGELHANGQWADATLAAGSAAATSTGNATSTATAVSGAAPASEWTVQATLRHLNPSAMHTQLAALLMDGSARAASRGTGIAFDTSLRAVNSDQFKGGGARRGAGNALGRLRLRDFSAAGNWDPDSGGGTLALSSLRLRTDEAELSGTLAVQPVARGGKASLALTAPGLAAQLQGELRPASGDGLLTVAARDAGLTLDWLTRLPGIPAQLAGATAAGGADLTLNWKGGWQDPSLEARLVAPSLDWRSLANPRAVEAQSQSPATDAAARSLAFRDIEATLAGKLGAARLDLQGRMQADGRRFALQLAASGGRDAASSGKLPSLTETPWQASVSKLMLSIEDPAVAEGAWRLVMRRELALRWTPLPSGGTLVTGAGDAVLTAPFQTASSALSGNTAPTQTVVQWQPVQWRNGDLTTSGKMTGLPLAWLERIGGPQLAGTGVIGNLVFDASWDAVVGEAISVKASVVRSGGDITVQGETAAGATARVAAGVKEARLTIDSNGDALTLALRWDSERAGNADGQITTRLTKQGDGGWTWPQDAPLRGQVRAQLPRIGVWSVLAPPGWRLRGSLGANIAVSGTRAEPQLAGELRADDLALRSVVDGIEFGNGRLRARLDGVRMRITEFTLQGAGANGAGGTITARGEAAWVNGKPQVLLDANLQRLRASIRTDRQVTLSGDLRARLEGRLAQFTGNLKVDQAFILLPEEGTPQLGEDVLVRSGSGAAAGQKGPSETRSRDAAGPATPQDARTLSLSVQLDLGQDFRVRGKGIDTLVRGSLALTGNSLAEPRLSGTVNTFRGQYRAYGQRLDIEQGILRFTGPIDNPALDILAVRPNMTQRVGVQITGTALLPRVRLYAQPELPDAEKLSWLVLGRGSASGGAEAALLQQAALALLGSKGGGRMSGGLAASIGLDELSFRGAASNADGTTAEGAVTLGKRFSRNFYAAYERSISGALGTLFVFYDLSQRFTVRAQAGQQSALDLIYTFQYD